jgi:hypothetical protein
VIKPVSDKLLVFSVRGHSLDASGLEADLATFSSVITAFYAGGPGVGMDVTTAYYIGAKGAIKGTITDAAGAVVANVPVAAINRDNEKLVYSTATNSEGVFLLENIPAGKYQIRAQATAGFRTYVSSDFEVRSQTLVILNIQLSTSVSAMVDVSSDSALQQASSCTSTNITERRVPTNFGFLGTQKSSTPRLREYFPETLVWQPELVTDKKGKAEMTFKMADNITTWKMYVIASTKKGKVGVAEKEITAFQPFFVDLDPPKFLTEGDEIFLPSQVRNYTDKRQQVDVTMAKAEWFDLLGPTSSG